MDSEWFSYLPVLCGAQVKAAMAAKAAGQPGGGAALGGVVGGVGSGGGTGALKSPGASAQQQQPMQSMTAEQFARLNPEQKQKLMMIQKQRKEQQKMAVAAVRASQNIQPGGLNHNSAGGIGSNPGAQPVGIGYQRY